MQSTSISVAQSVAAQDYHFTPKHGEGEMREAVKAGLLKGRLRGNSLLEKEIGKGLGSAYRPLDNSCYNDYY
jgi:hypothetical protein